jgi:hypothetical protein
MQWLECRFRPNGGGLWSGDQFRKFVAAKIGSKNPRLFWRNESGDPLHGVPFITFVGQKNWCGIRVIGDSTFARDAEIALSAASPIANALDDEFGGLHTIEVMRGKLRLDASSPTKYHIRRLALSRCLCRAKREEILRELPRPVAQTAVKDEHLLMIESVIMNDLRQQFQGVYGFSFLERPLWATPFLAGGELVFAVKNISFRIMGRIVGPVQVGSLRARGYGDVKIII